MHIQEAIVTKAIFDSMSAEDREQLLTGAIKSLLEKPNSTDYFSKDKRSKIEVAFDDAAWKIVQSAALEILNRPEIRVKIEDVIQEAIKRAFEGEVRERLIYSLSLSFVGFFKALAEK